MDELESQVNELQRNPLKLATNQRIELLLEKDRVKQQKLKDFK